jgi:hypothetical protein
MPACACAYSLANEKLMNIPFSSPKKELKMYFFSILSMIICLSG